MSLFNKNKKKNQDVVESSETESMTSDINNPGEEENSERRNAERRNAEVRRESPEKIKNNIDELNIKSVQQDEAVEKSNDSQMPRIAVTVASDKLSASIKFIKNDTKRPVFWTENMVIDELKEAGISFGMDPRMIKRACAFPMYDVDIKVVQGIAPQKGRSGYVEYRVKKEESGKPFIREDGSVDYKNMGFAVPIKKGDILCKLVPPEDGVDGTDVFGQTIPAQRGDDYVFREGKNVDIVEDEDGTSYAVASVGGTVEFGNDTIGVNDTLVIKEGVGHSTGNVFTYGNLIINTVVLSGFEVEAGGDIEVKGYVEGAKLTAGNDIKISTGIKGMGKGEIIAGGNITFPFAESASIDAGGMIYADAILNCNIRCGEDLQVQGKKGTIVGGNIEVGGSLVAKTIGTAHSALTTIVMSRRGYATKELRPLIEEREKLIDRIMSLNPTVDLFSRMGDVTRLSKEKMDYFMGVLTEYKRLQEESDKLTEKIDEIVKLREENQAPQIIKCSGYIYVGTRVAFEETIQMNIENDLLNSSLYLSNGEIVIGSYI